MAANGQIIKPSSGGTFSNIINLDDLFGMSIQHCVKENQAFKPLWGRY